MLYHSTKSQKIKRSFSEALKRGLAFDGGLFVPEKIPLVNWQDFNCDTYYLLAKEILQNFLKDDVLLDYLEGICQKAFDFPVKIKFLDNNNNNKNNNNTNKSDSDNNNIALLELFHGPTCAFKDFGARFLANCFDVLDQIENNNKERIVLVATSGDTGGAVASAFYKKRNVKVILLFPEKGVSPRQKQQLTCWEENIISLAVKGTFDDCQKLVKMLQMDEEFRKNKIITSANSINIGRLLPQIVYYAYSSITFYKTKKFKPNFIIPSGNLGNAVAAFYAKKMNFPIEKIILSLNKNDAIYNFFKTNKYIPQNPVKTLANAMDVGNPSNIERLLNLYNQDVSLIKQDSQAYCVNDSEITQCIKSKFWDEIICPHTATAFFTQKKLNLKNSILVATAHPAKFNEIVEPLVKQNINIPFVLEKLLKKKNNFDKITTDINELKERI